ncbi:hypothetical protein [Streptomyces sp. NRRL S-87]|uniref:hypothetical protein n=1 Tax=Streptomyces sp. NRRL S-87 TaxID=1463920 RepID=UPI000A615955|nr:hypothetical protein [Streptomyces sp. NRRL S-87]
MSQAPKSALSNLNVVLPMVYAAAIVVSAAFGNGKVTGVVAAAGGILLGAFYAFRGRNRDSGV